MGNNYVNHVIEKRQTKNIKKEKVMDFIRLYIKTNGRKFYKRKINLDGDFILDLFSFQIFMVRGSQR